MVVGEGRARLPCLRLYAHQDHLPPTACAANREKQLICKATRLKFPARVFGYTRLYSRHYLCTATELVMKTSSATGFQLLVVALCLSKFSALGATITAAAYVTPVDEAKNTAKSHYGYIKFSQDTPTVENTKNTNPVTVDVSNLRGFPTGLYGFHVHQFGDLESPGTHFIPICSEPDPTSPGANVTSCTDDTVHGFPLTPGNNKYQAGDLGNIQCDANNIDNNNNCKICKCTANTETEQTNQDSGTQRTKYLAPTCNECTSTKQFKGEKLTLRPPPASVDDIDRSITARAIVVHAKTDNGGPPFGGVRTKH